MDQFAAFRFALDALDRTPEERARLQDTPFLSTPEEWRWSGALVHEKALEGYAAGEMDLRRVLEVTRAGALGCCPQDRRMLAWLTVERALRITPQRLNRQRPRYPHWLREVAGDLVRQLEERNPEKAVAPNTYRDSSPVLDQALAWLRSQGLNSDKAPIRPWTLYRWYLKRLPTVGITPRPGRKPKAFKSAPSST